MLTVHPRMLIIEQERGRFRRDPVREEIVRLSFLDFDLNHRENNPVHVEYVY